MRIIETKVYKFDELSDDAKEFARQWWRDCENQDSSTFDYTYEDVATIAETFGLDIRTRPVKLMNNTTRYDPCIYFSGFSSQGDGACFEGEYRYKAGALKAIKSEYPKNEDLHRIVKELQELQRKNFYRIHCSMRHRGHYYHSGCMQVECENSHDSYLPVVGEDEFIQCMRDFADWIYKRLEDEYDWIMSDEQVDESIVANEYEFNESGDIL